jgi:hypothetical protein
MIHSPSLARVALSATLLLAATASTAHCEPYDALGIQNQSHYMPFGPNGPKTANSTLGPTKVMNDGKFGQKTRTAQRYRVAQRTAPARTTRFDDLNLSVTTPTGPWTKLDPQKTGSHACLLLSRTNPNIMISLAGQEVGIESADTNTSLLAASQDKMRTLPGATIEPGEQQISAGGIPGVAFTATVADGQSTAYYTIWVAAHHGYTYKLAVYGDQLHKRMIDEAMQNFLGGIKQIQSNRVARADSYLKTLTR